MSEPLHARRPVAGSEKYVVCNDGSVWQYLPKTGEWRELPPIPGTIRYREITDGMADDPGSEFPGAVNWTGE